MADLLVQVYSDAAGDNHPQSAATISTNREASVPRKPSRPRTLWHAPRHPRTQHPSGDHRRADLLAPIAPVPREIIVPVEPARREELEGWLTNLRGGAVTIRVASRGDKKQLMDRANENASQALQRSKMSRISDMGARTQAMNDVAKALGLAEARCASNATTFRTLWWCLPGGLHGGVRRRDRQEIRIPTLRHPRQGRQSAVMICPRFTRRSPAASSTATSPATPAKASTRNSVWPRPPAR